MTGTERQIAWAASIRQKRHEDIEAFAPAGTAERAAIDAVLFDPATARAIVRRAKWWIDGRDWDIAAVIAEASRSRSSAPRLRPSATAPLPLGTWGFVADESDSDGMDDGAPSLEHKRGPTHVSGATALDW